MTGLERAVIDAAKVQYSASLAYQNCECEEIHCPHESEWERAVGALEEAVYALSWQKAHP